MLISEFLSDYVETLPESTLSGEILKITHNQKVTKVNITAIFKEIVSYEDFITELENDSCGGCLTFLGYISLEDLIEKEFKINKITIPTGCSCGIFNSFAGGGSLMEIETTKEIVLENNDDINFQIIIDNEQDRYSFQRIYGIIKSYYFNKTLIIE
jgi:hypothetical protein